MQQTNSKRVQDLAWVNRKGDALGTSQGIQIWPDNQMVYANTRSRPSEQEFWDKNR